MLPKNVSHIRDFFLPPPPSNSMLGKKFSHLMSYTIYRGVASETWELIKTRTPSSAWISWKKEYNPDRYTSGKPCTMILVFYSASCVDWSTVEDSTWWGFKASNSPFCKSGAVMVSLIPLKSKRAIPHTLSSSIPSLVLISLLPAPQLDVTKSFLERPQRVETRNKKQDEKIKLNRKNWKGNFW